MTQPVYAFWFCTLISIFVFAPFGCNIVAFDIVDFQEPGIKSINAAATALSYPTLFFLTKPKPEGPKHKSDDRQHRDAKSKCQFDRTKEEKAQKSTKQQW
jgi:hypothetical protein